MVICRILNFLEIMGGKWDYLGQELVRKYTQIRSKKIPKITGHNRAVEWWTGPGKKNRGPYENFLSFLGPKFISRLQHRAPNL
jgi:hypothetical protein